MVATGDKIYRAVTYGLLIKEVLEKVIIRSKDPKESTENTTCGSTGNDELFFFTSLMKFENVSDENKNIFFKKHYELLSPDFNGKNADKTRELREKERLAKRLIALIASEQPIFDQIPEKKFQCANEIWHGIFMGIESFSSENLKLQLLEERILYFGKNSREEKIISEMGKKVQELAKKIITDPFNEDQDKGKTALEKAKAFRLKMKERREAAEIRRRTR